MAAGGKFITRWLMLSLGIIILIVYFAVYAPSSSSSYTTDYTDVAESDMLDPVVINEPMIEQGIMRGGRGKKDHEIGALERLKQGPEEVEVITLEVPDVKPTRLMPVRPTKTADDGAGAADTSTSTTSTSTTTETSATEEKETAKATSETSTTDTKTMKDTGAASAGSNKEKSNANTGDQETRDTVGDPGDMWF